MQLSEQSTSTPTASENLNQAQHYIWIALVNLASGFGVYIFFDLPKDYSWLILVGCVSAIFFGLKATGKIKDVKEELEAN